MVITKRIVCLANSRKMAGRCIAGKELAGAKVGAWIRPVSEREHQEVSEQERRYEDGSDPKILDVIDVPLIEHRPAGCQVENWLIDTHEHWRLADKLTWDQLQELQDASGPLWVNKYSTANGMNDQVPLAIAETQQSSLRFIHVERCEIHVLRIPSPYGPGRRRVQCRFVHDGQHYWLWVTDPVLERTYLAQANGAYVLGESYLTISLGEPFKEHCYKLVAAIITR